MPSVSGAALARSYTLLGAEPLPGILRGWGGCWPFSRARRTHPLATVSSHLRERVQAPFLFQTPGKCLMPSWGPPLLGKMTWLLEESHAVFHTLGPPLVQNGSCPGDRALVYATALAAVAWLLLPLLLEAKRRRNMQAFPERSRSSQKLPEISKLVCPYSGQTYDAVQLPRCALERFCPVSSHSG